MSTSFTRLLLPALCSGRQVRSARHPGGAKTSARLGALCLLAVAPLSAHAQVSYVSGGRNLVLKPLYAPFSVVPGAHASDTTVWWFAENKNVTVPNTVGVVPYKNYLKVNGTTPGATLTGKVNCWMVFTNNVTGSKVFDMTVWFSEKIVGIIVKAKVLDASDRFLGLSGTRYPYLDTTRGMDKGGPDYVAFGGDGHTLTIHVNTVRNVDEVRVLTAPAGR